MTQAHPSRRRVLQAGVAASLAAAGVARAQSSEKILIGFWPIASGLTALYGAGARLLGRADHGRVALARVQGRDADGKLPRPRHAEAVAHPEFVRVKAHALEVFRREVNA